MDADGILKLAILAVGGQGGGVLAGWIEAMARTEGFTVQATSMAGVAQRTGATVYYIEMAPVRAGGRAPVFALAPAPGDVDVLIAAEMMEAGRAILRGFVTPDRTILIASTHRALAVSEKTAPGDAIASSEEVAAAAEVAARGLVMADFEALAIGSGSVISASLMGGLAASGALPFLRTAFEEAIRSGGRGVEASLRAFASAFDAVRGGGGRPSDVDAGDVAAPKAPLPVSGGPVEEAGTPALAPTGPARMRAAWDQLVARVDAMPAEVAAMARPGLRKVVDFQDAAYGAAYLDRIEGILARDGAAGGGARGHALTREAAKYVAVAMAYDDVIRVADLKTRPARMARIRAEMGATEGRLLRVTEYMHPRAEEIAGMLPARLGARVAASPRAMAGVARVFAHGRRVRTDGLAGHLVLHAIGGLRWWRPRTLRYAQEMAHLDAWLDRAMERLPEDYALAVEILRCRRLVKGYSDTHARGLSKFDRVLGAVPILAGRDDAADWVRRLREAALRDEAGSDLDGALRTIAQFA